ncbi:hypothetical protein GCM10009665_11820 [Kitasatospora nipponensis]|uniref:Uncharacterized protein n=1 Tax=Kitasatospora nipponensis TaxID=258049 RepID=A0ABP4GJC9_9ACTN
MDLSVGLREWTDDDWAAFRLGQSLGVFSEVEAFSNVKYVFWGVNPLGNALHQVLLQLAQAGVLEQSESQDQFRWSGRLLTDPPKPSDRA